MKWYVKEWTEFSPDEEELQVIEVMESKPSNMSYLIFLEK